MGKDCSELHVGYNMLYRHHIIPRHVGGSDDPSNIKMVTHVEHAEEHRKLYEQHGRWQDKVAWKALTGQIPHEEASRQAGILANLGKKRTKETKERMSVSQKGNFNALGSKRTPNQRLAQSTRTAGRGKNYTDATKYKLSIGMMGKRNSLGSKHTEEHKQKMSVLFSGIPHTKVICPNCGETGGTSIMKRWHFTNCKGRSVK
jgi:NUMOD3 motif